MNSKQNIRLTSNFEKSKDKLHRIYERIPIKVLKEKPEIEQLVFPEPMIIYNVINKIKKPEKLIIPKGISEVKEKKLKSLEEFKEVLYQFNQKKTDDENIENIKIENKIFCNNYEKLLKEKNKYKTGTYVDQEYLFIIANRYAQKGIKIPEISKEKNIFKSNPLILNGSELEYYFLYNLGDKYKSSKFLNKVEDLVDRKLTGNFILTDEEAKRLEFLQKNEKPKGFIPYEQLIPKLKNDIMKTQLTIDNLPKVNIETIETAKSRNIQKENNINDYSTNITSSHRGRIKLKKSLSLANYNKFSNRVNSSISTKEYSSKRFSLLNPKMNFPLIEFNKNNISNEIIKDYPINKIPIKIEKKNLLNFLNQNDNLNTNNKNNIRPPFSSFNRVNVYDKLILNKKKILSKRSIKSINSLTSVRTKSLGSAISKKSKMNTIENLTNNTIGNNIFDEIKVNNMNLPNKNNIVFDFFKEKKIKENNNNNIKINSKDEIYKECESIFDSLLEGKYKSRRNVNVLKDFLKSRGYNIDNKLIHKTNVLNVNRIKNKSIERNFIMEEYKIRNRENGKSPLTEEQQAIINKNEQIVEKIGKNDYILKKLICEKNIEKETFD